MTELTAGTVVRLEGAQAALRDHFLGWQCRLRQYAVRKAEGRPTSGMRPQVEIPGEAGAAGEIILLIVQSAPEEMTAQFRHLVRRTHDPAERYKNALKHLGATYYQHPQDFSDELTALFGPGAELAERLLAAGRCTLRFEQYSQRYVLPCRVRGLAESEPAFQATYWHNSLFNRNIPAGVRVLGFQPDWAEAEADPPLGQAGTLKT
jgi:hypothetical protein